MTPEQCAANEAYVRDLADAEAAIPGGLTAGMPIHLRMCGDPPDPVLLAALEAEVEAWVAAGRPLPPEPTPEEWLKGHEERAAKLLTQGHVVTPKYLEWAREEAKLARHALDNAATRSRPEPTR